MGYDPKGGNEKGLEFAKIKPQVVIGSMKEFTKPQYKVDVLKVEVPINAEFVEGSSVYKGEKAYIDARRPWTYFRQGRGSRHQAVHLPERGRRQRAIRREPDAWPRKPARIIRASCAAARPGKTACRSTPPRA